MVPTDRAGPSAQMITNFVNGEPDYSTPVINSDPVLASMKTTASGNGGTTAARTTTTGTTTTGTTPPTTTPKVAGSLFLLPSLLLPLFL